MVASAQRLAESIIKGNGTYLLVKSCDMMTSSHSLLYRLVGESILSSASSMTGSGETEYFLSTLTSPDVMMLSAISNAEGWQEAISGETLSSRFRKSNSPKAV